MIRITSLVLTLILVSCSANGAPSCSVVVQDLAPCLPYLKDNASSPSDTCCGGIKDLKAVSPTHNDLVAVCNCIKDALNKVGKIDLARGSALAGQCGVAIKLPPLSPSMDCSKVGDGGDQRRL